MLNLILAGIFFSFSSCKIDLGSYQKTSSQDFIVSEYGSLVLDYVKDVLKMEDASMLYVEKQIVSGINFKLTLVSKDRTFHLIKFHIPPGKKEVHVLQHTQFMHGLNLLEEDNVLKKEIWKSLTFYFHHKFSGGEYKFIGFRELNVYQGLKPDERVIHAIYRIKDSTNAFNVLESILVKKEKFQVEDYLHASHSLFINNNKENSSDSCSKFESIKSCIFDRNCIPNTIFEFSVCSRDEKVEHNEL